MTLGIGFNNPNYNSKYSAENIRQHMNAKAEADSVRIKKKSNNGSEAAGVIASIGLAIGSIFAFKNRGKLKNLQPYIKSGWENTKKFVKDSIPKVSENCKSLFEKSKEAVKNIFKKKA